MTIATLTSLLLSLSAAAEGAANDATSFADLPGTISHATAMAEAEDVYLGRDGSDTAMLEYSAEWSRLVWTVAGPQGAVTLDAFNGSALAVQFQ